MLRLELTFSSPILCLQSAPLIQAYFIMCMAYFLAVLPRIEFANLPIILAVLLPILFGIVAARKTPHWLEVSFESCYLDATIE